MQHNRWMLVSTFAVTLFVLGGCGGTEATVESGMDVDAGGAPSFDVPATDTEAPADVPEAADLAEPDGKSADTGQPSCHEPCDDEDPCTENDRCRDGVCKGDQKSCDDDEPCTSDRCDESSGDCVYEAGPDEACDDRDPCTEDDICAAGVCVGQPVVCDDGEDCTLDSCSVEAGGCAFVPTPGEPCDDLDPCTDDDACTEEGICDGIATTIDCDDGVSCTVDFCDDQGACEHVPDETGCDDGRACVTSFCDLTDGCVSFGVVAAAPLQDGSLADWPDNAEIAENTFVSNTSGGELHAIFATVSTAGLHLALDGRVDANNAWLVFLDLDYGNASATGVTDLTTIASDDPLEEVARAAIAVGDPRFGADFLVGGVGPVGTGELDAAVGCRDLSAPDAPGEVPCAVHVDGASKSIEVTIPWSSVPGGEPAADEVRTTAGFAVVVGVVGPEASNQFLPGQLPPVDDLFFFPIAGGECLSPFCGDGVIDPGESCDDANDDPGDDCDACSRPVPEEMVEVPEGDFVMGSDTDVQDDPARPIHTVWLPTYYIDRLEVTNAQFAAFLTARGSVFDDLGDPIFECGDTHAEIDCLPGGDFIARPGFEDHPVGETFWPAAYEYCQWAGKRLPTEAEWEKAARGTESWLYPWGMTFEPASLNCKEYRCGDGYTYTAPVGSFPQGASPYGALDMAGNVWEWTNDWFDADYFASSPYENPQGPCAGQMTCALSSVHVARGGSWDDDEDHTNTVFRYAPEGGCNSDIGFRCAATTPPPTP